MGKLRNNCDFQPCSINGTESCVQTWDARTCHCKEGYYGNNCEKGGPCECKNKKEKDPVQVTDDSELIVATEESVLRNLNLTTSSETNSTIDNSVPTVLNSTSTN